MAITHPTSIRDELSATVVGHLDDGASPGKIRVYTGGVGGTLLVEIVLADPAFTAPVLGVASAAGLPKEGTATVGGTADSFEVTDSDNNQSFAGTVTGLGAGGDMEISSPSVAISDVIRVNTFTYKAAA